MVGTYTPTPAPTETWESSVAAPPPRQQSTWERFSQKFKEEPLVPIGIVATVAALLGATSALQKGNRTQFNKMLRYRVAAQGVTVVAALGGSIYYQQERRATRDAEQAAKAAAKAEEDKVV
ncbi:hypoxia induced protein conserved region-domain-containing protein [Leucosporidium creatinivorum]|uniref:Hypoxia induced protein conserved region-domain-containing protein n=1 Tax=Leucosporidium creatinivorum TaxID=106004 RepID=A0A1Y2G442_9BASI|nr:hypoxia induced protein conserved region-domain-containing protein [Leucosporidium creatinivorum]